MVIRPVSLLSSLSGCNLMNSALLVITLTVAVIMVRHNKNHHGIDDGDHEDVDRFVRGDGIVRLVDTAKAVDSSSLSWTTVVTPVAYPLKFSIPFVTNVTDAIDDNDGNNTSQPVIHGMLYYDWTRRVQRIDHGPGSYECVHFYDTDRPCSLLFRMDGMYRLLPKKLPSPSPLDNDDEDDGSVVVIDCCLDLPNIGTPPPDWASQAPSRYQGPVWDDYAQSMATEWWFDNTLLWRTTTTTKTTAATTMDHVPDHDKDNHITTTTTTDEHDNDTTRTVYSFHTVRQVGIIPPKSTTITRSTTNNAKMTANKNYWGRPLLFTFPGTANGRQDMHFEYQSMKVGPLDPQAASSLFDLPKGSQQQRCKNNRIGFSNRKSATLE